MKMEVLSVQNQFQGHQFGVMGSTKVKDWATPLTAPPYHHHSLNNQQVDNDVQIASHTDDGQLQALSQRLQDELRAAKSRHLACTEVLLPADLLHIIAGDMIKLAEEEPCGIRGCSLFIEFEDEPSNSRRIASVQIDTNTVSTFELYLTLKQNSGGWTSILPQFLKNLARGSTIVIDADYKLTKVKLYRSE